MHNTPFLRALVASAALALDTPAMAAPVGGVLTLGDVAQASALGSIDLGGPALLLGTASTLYEDDAPLTAGALNLSGTAAADVATLTHDMGLPGDAFDDMDNAAYAYEGAAAFANVDVRAGDTLHFDWRLFGQLATGPLPTFDAAWLVIGQDIVRLGDTSAAGTLQGDWLDFGLRHVSHTFTQAGSVRIGVVLTDVNSFDGTSVLAVQNLALTPAVPEPESVALLLAGLGVVAGARRRRQAGQ